MNVRNIRPTPDTYRGVTPRGVTPRGMGREDVSPCLSFDRERDQIFCYFIAIIYRKLIFVLYCGNKYHAKKIHNNEYFLKSWFLVFKVIWHKREIAISVNLFIFYLYKIYTALYSQTNVL